MRLSKDDIRSTALGDDLWSLYRLFIVDVMMDYDVFMETMNATAAMDHGEGGRSLPWNPVARETDLLPTHMAIKALFVCPNEHSADDDVAKKLLAHPLSSLGKETVDISTQYRAACSTQ